MISILKENILKTTVLLYILLVITLLYTQPKMFYVNNNPETQRLKKFGTGNKNTKTIFPLWLVFIVFGILLYALVCLVNSYL